MIYTDKEKLTIKIDEKGCLIIYDSKYNEILKTIDIEPSNDLFSRIGEKILEKQNRQIQELQQKLQSAEETIEKVKKYIEEFKLHLVTAHLSGKQELLERPLDFLIALYRETEGIKQKTKKTEETKEFKKEIKEPVKNF